MIFTEITLLLLLGYTVVLTYGYLNWNLLIFTETGEFLSSVMGQWTLLLSLIFVPFAMMWMIFLPIPYINSNSFTDIWRGLVFNVKTSGILTAIYYLTFMIRRILFVSVAFNFDDLPAQ